MENKRIKRKKPSSLPSILSLASVLFLLGIMAVTWLSFKGLGNYWLETSSLDIYFQEEVTETQVAQFEKQVQRKPWVKTTRFVSRDQAMKEMGEKYDPQFLNYIETVTLPLSLEIYPKAEYAKTAFMNELVKYFKQQPGVEDVIFQQNWLEMMTANLEKIQWSAAALAFLLCIVAVVLIQSSVRLGIFANRHTIKSMQLVGATNGFIMRPFVLKFIGHALIAAPLAFSGIALIFWGIPRNTDWFPMLKNTTEHIDLTQLIIFAWVITLFGVVLAAFSSWLSTRKFLKMKIDSLY
jgi:cell division transport system permease protein